MVNSFQTPHCNQLTVDHRPAKTIPQHNWVATLQVLQRQAQLSCRLVPCEDRLLRCDCR